MRNPRLLPTCHIVLAAMALCLLLCITGFTETGDRERDRVQESGQVLKEILDTPEDIPQDLLNKAECVIIIPSVKKVAVGIGGSYGRGAMTCRGGQDFTGAWGAPTMMKSTGANIGFQFGGQSTDFVILVMNDKGARSMMKSKLKLGTDASIAAGPKGRTATAATNPSMRAEMLSYSRSRGVFGGVSLEGATLMVDSEANENLYGKKVSADDVVVKGTVPPPEAASALLATLNTHAPRNVSANK